MQYGFCTNLAFLDNDDIGKATIEGLAEAGYDYVELPFSALSEQGDISAVKKALDEAGLPCRACNLFFPPALTLVGKNQDIVGIETYLQRMLPLAEEMGIETLVFGNGGARKVPAGESREDVWANLRRIAELMEKYASQTTVKICIEHLNTTETDMVTSYKEAVALASGLKHVGAMVDSYHFLMDKQDYAAVLENPGVMWHVHTAYSTKRLVPGLDDDMSEYGEVQRTLKQIGYDGKISIEGGFRGTTPADIKKEIKDALSVLKALF